MGKILNYIGGKLIVGLVEWPDCKPASITEMIQAVSKAEPASLSIELDSVRVEALEDMAQWQDDQRSLAAIISIIDIMYEQGY